MSGEASGNAGSSGAALPPGLARALVRIEDVTQRRRLERFLHAAAAAIGRLSDLDLASHSTEEPQDLDATGFGVWEVLAPALRDTVHAINALLEALRAELGHGVSADPPDDSPLGRAARVVRGLGDGLAEQLHTFADGMRQTQLVGDRWSLLDHIARFRGRSRRAVGEMVFVIGQAMGETAKEDLIPHFREDMDDAVLLRTGLRGLCNDVATLQARLEGSAAAEVVLEVGRLVHDRVDQYVGSQAYGRMRQPDKRALLLGRRALRESLGQAPADTGAVAQDVHALAQFLDSLWVLNQRELLVINDREVAAQIQGQLHGLARSVSAGDELGARAALAASLSAARRLYGRATALDQVLVRGWALDVAHLALPQVAALGEQLGQRLSEVMGMLGQ